MMEINRELNEKLIENAHATDGTAFTEWILEAIAVALYRIANALEKQNEEAELERERQEIKNGTC